VREIDHSRCCFSALDKHRHELDRGIRRAEKWEARRGYAPRSVNDHIITWTARLRFLEEATFERHQAEWRETRQMEGITLRRR